MPAPVGEARSFFGRVERVAGSAPWYAYGVVNDNGTNDGSFVPPVPERAAERLVLPDAVVVRDVTVVDVENARVLDHRDIVIEGGKIVAVEPTRKVAPPPGTVIDGRGFVALPGFVDTHTHLWQQMAKGFHPDGNLQEWVTVYDYADRFEPRELYRVVLAAAGEALLSGITTVADDASMNYRDEALEQVVRALRAASVDGAVVWWHPAEFLPPSAKARAIRGLRNLDGDAVDVWMGFGPLSFFDVPVVYDGVLLARELGMRTTEHTMENVQEQRDFRVALQGHLRLYGDRLSDGDGLALRRVAGMNAPSGVDAMLHVWRLAALLVYACGPRDFDTVLSNGRIVVRGGELVGRSEEVLAAELSEIAEALVERGVHGTAWDESLTVPRSALARYRAVQADGSVDLTLVNGGPGPVTVQVAMSASSLGGEHPLVLRREALSRFQLDPPESSWVVTRTIPAGRALRVERPAGGSRQLVTLPGESPAKLPSTEAHQLLLTTQDP